MMGLGVTIRALRYGFYIAAGKALMRLSIAGPGRFRAEFRPVEHVPTRSAAPWPHVVWWAQDSKIDPNEIEAVRNLVKCKRAFTVYFDDDGRATP